MNPSATPIEGTLVFKAAATRDVVVPWALGAKAARVYADVSRDLGTSGVGSIEVHSSDTLPRVSAHLISGGVHAVLPTFSSDDALVTGEHGYLNAPTNANARFNIAVRTLAEGATIRSMLRSAAGAVLATTTTSISRS